MAHFKPLKNDYVNFVAKRCCSKPCNLFVELSGLV